MINFTTEPIYNKVISEDIFLTSIQLSDPRNAELNDLKQVNGIINSNIVANDIFSEYQFGCIVGYIEKLDPDKTVYSGMIQVIHENSRMKLFEDNFTESFYVPNLNLNEKYIVKCIPLENDIYQSKTVTMFPIIDLNKKLNYKITLEYFSNGVYSCMFKVYGFLGERFSISVSYNSRSEVKKINDNIFIIRIIDSTYNSKFYIDLISLDDASKNRSIENIISTTI